MGQKAWQWQPLRCRSWLLAIAATSGRKQLADASRLDTVVAVEDRRSYCQTPQALAAPRRGGGGHLRRSRQAGRTHVAFHNEAISTGIEERDWHLLMLILQLPPLGRGRRFPVVAIKRLRRSTLTAQLVEAEVAP